MTQTTSHTEPHAAAVPNIASHPTDILMGLIVTLLAPMFLSLAGGDITYARMAAIETVNAYRVRNNADLITIAQIIAFGLAALDSISLSMQDNVSVSMALRLRGNANALNRAAQQNRRVHEASLKADPAPHLPEHRHDAPKTRETLPLTHHPAAATLAEDAQSPLQAPTVAAVNPAAAEKRHQEMWAIAMVKEASEITASIPNLPPAERSAATIRAAALTSTANHLLTGVSPPLPTPRPTAPI